MLAGATVLRADEYEPLLLFLGGLGLAALLLGLAVRWSAALAVSVALLGAQQAVRLALGPDALDAWAPLVAGALLLVPELAWWSIEPRVPAWSEPWLAWRRLATVLLTCAGASLVSALVVVAAGAEIGGGFAIELLGVIAATAALALVAWAAHARASGA